MNYQEFLQNRYLAELDIIIPRVIQTLESVYKRPFDRNEQQRTAREVGIIINPIYSNEKEFNDNDDILNRLLYNKLFQINPLNQGLETLIKENEDLDLFDQMYLDSVIEAYGEGDEGAKNFLTYRINQCQIRMGQITEELNSSAELDEEGRNNLSNFVDDVLKHYYLLRLEEAQKTYGTIPEECKMKRGLMFKVKNKN